MKELILRAFYNSVVILIDFKYSKYDAWKYMEPSFVLVDTAFLTKDFYGRNSE